MKSMSQPLHITGLILAGGQSRRFGSDKAMHQIDGVTMIEKAYRTLSEVAKPVFISLANDQQKRILPARHVVDEFKNRGPLGGLHAGLKAAETTWVFVTAVDMPFINKESILFILDQISPDVKAIVTRSSDKIQPLFGCYRTTLVQKLEGQINSNKLSAIQFVKEIPALVLEMPASVLTNINQPDDLV